MSLHILPRARAAVISSPSHPAPPRASTAPCITRRVRWPPPPALRSQSKLSDDSQPLSRPTLTLLSRTFWLSNEAAAQLPQQAQLALQQVDNCKSCCLTSLIGMMHANHVTVKYFLISAPVDWVPEQYIRRFLLPTGEYVSCVLW